MQTNETFKTATLSLSTWVDVIAALDVAEYRARQEEKEAAKVLDRTKNLHGDSGLICRDCERTEKEKVRAAREAMGYKIAKEKILSQTHI